MVKPHKKERFVALPHYVVGTFAWSRLSVTAKAAWLELARVYNGSNNGKLAMPIRMLGERLGTEKDAAANAIHELLTFGFIKRTKASSFGLKRVSSEYMMTHLPDDRTDPKGLPSREFQNIGKEPSNVVPFRQ